MNWTIESFIKILLSWTPFSANLVFGILIIYTTQLFFNKRVQTSAGGKKFYYQLGIFALVNIVVITLIISSPLTEVMKGQLLNLLGITFTAAIALSSTTFLGNIMAGLMLKVLNKFKPGDFLHIEKNFGRVTELGLLHTEIQTQDRDLLTLPNIYLVSNPVKVIRTSGTIISEDISLGYDVHHNKVEKALLQAAENSKLEDSFMHIQSLGDYSVTFRISGFLKDIKTIISTKAKLREDILDALHSHRIEIVSPSFMNQRVFDTSKTFIPHFEKDTSNGNSEGVENIIFDKAEQAESIQDLKSKIEKYNNQIKDINDDQHLSKEEREKKVENCRSKIQIVKGIIKAKEE